MSLNLVAVPPGQALRDQYRVDMERGTIAAHFGQSGTEALLAPLPELAGGKGGTCWTASGATICIIGSVSAP